MSNKKMRICDVTIHSGECANLALPLPERYSCSPLFMPIRVIHGKEPGPCLLLISLLTGIEMNGLEIVNRITEEMQGANFAGTLISIPALNVYGLTHQPNTLPSTQNLANSFPGDEDGSYGQRIAHAFTKEILRKADYCIEFQTGQMNHNILPQVYCNFDNKRSKQLAKVFQTPVITNVSLENNGLRQATESLGIPLLVYQAGEAMRFDESSISFGVEGVKNVMREVDMLQKAPVKDINPIFSRDEDWIISHSSGVLHTEVSLGQSIKEGEVIGKVSDPFGTGQVESILSPQEGVVVGINMTPLVYEGLPIFKIASFYDDHQAEAVIEEWDQKQPDSYLNA